MAAATALLSLAAAPGRALADPVLLGGETASMGGAGVASAQDAAAFFLNPAGLAQIRSFVATANASIYGVSRISIDRFFNGSNSSSTLLGDTELDSTALESSKLAIYPSAIALMAGFGPPAGQSGHMTLGLTYLTLNRSDYFFEGQAKAEAYPGRHGTLWSHSYAAHYFGPSFAMQLGSRVRLGATVFGVYTAAENLVSSPYELSDDDGVVFVANDSRLGAELSSLDLVFAAGAQVKITDYLTAGASIHAPSAHLAGSISGTGELRSYGNDMSLLRVETTLIDGEARASQPMLAMLGLSYRVPRRFGVAVDLQLSLPRAEAEVVETTDETTLLRPLDKPSTSTTERTTTTDYDVAYTISVGGELFFAPTWAVRAGFFYSTPVRQDFGDTITTSDILDLRLTKVGGTIALANHDSLIESTFGLAISAGSGDTGAYTFASDELRKTSVSSLHVLFFVSGGFNLVRRGDDANR